MKARVLLLPGDGVGPEVLLQARRALETIGSRWGHELEFREADLGGAAIRAWGVPLPLDTVEACRESDAALLGAVGDPRYDEAPERPESALLGLRKHFGLFANLRPVRLFPALAHRTPFRPEILDGVDVLFVRELTGGIYFGPRREQEEGSEAFDTLVYSVDEVERIARVAFEAARTRRGRVTSVDKANVLASSRLWRRTVNRVAEDYPDVVLDHVLVDAFAMHILRRPETFDVVLTGNMFGDILSDEASVLAGSLGMLPSASQGAERFGLYEPVHGSAPDIAGRGVANPVGALLSAAMMLRFSLGLEAEAAALEFAVEQTLAAGVRTADLWGDEVSAVQEMSTDPVVSEGKTDSARPATTSEFGDSVLTFLREASRTPS